MDFVSNQEPQIQEMLKVIGISSIEELFVSIPKSIHLPPPSDDDGLSEYEGLQLMRFMAAENTFPLYENYLGGGAYEHHVPALVSAVCSKSEFLTSYTPYQAEASQGMLQAIFEFQSSICALTGMDAANASVYDGASACAEAVLMSLRLQKGKRKVLIAESLNPHYRAVVEQYSVNQDGEIETLPFGPDGRLDRQALVEKLDENIASVMIQSPNFWGNIEELKEIATLAHRAGALFILCANPLSYGLYASAKEAGADIAVGDCQPFGLSLQFGGPYAGYMACRQEFIRQMPGRIVGETSDTEGRRGFVLTLQAREQHIRREKSTSNICTNQALAALASLVAMLWYGKEGIPALASTCYRRAAYLREGLSKIPGVRLMNDAPVFNEFAVKFPKPFAEVQAIFREQGIEPGIDLGGYFSSLADYLLVAVTETKSQAQLDRYIQVARRCCE